MKKTENMPSWAYWGLWGINSRKVALGCFIGTLILSLVLVPVGIMIKDYSFLAFVFVPLWYWLSLKWADNNAAWEKSENS